MARNITLTDYVWMISNPIDRLAVVKRTLFPEQVSFKGMLNGDTIKVRGKQMEITFGGRKVRFYKGNGPVEATTRSWINGTFFLQEYKQMNVKGRFVLDIGASIGDTALYFYCKGAKGIESYEPDRELCAVAGKNLRLNKVTNVKMFNEPASSRTIDRFASKFKGKPKVLKIDCEGAEYEMIFNSKRLREYDELIIEYHYGYINLEKRIKEMGFEVSHTRPHLSRDMNVGLVFARRLGQRCRI